MTGFWQRPNLFLFLYSLDRRTLFRKCRSNPARFHENYCWYRRFSSWLCQDCSALIGSQFLTSDMGTPCVTSWTRTLGGVRPSRTAFINADAGNRIGISKSDWSTEALTIVDTQAGGLAPLSAPRMFFYLIEKKAESSGRGWHCHPTADSTCRSHRAFTHRVD